MKGRNVIGTSMQIIFLFNHAGDTNDYADNTNNENYWGNKQE